VLDICQVARSTWYYHNKEKKEINFKSKQGRPRPGYSYDSDGTIISDEEIVEVLKNIRHNQEFNRNAGGYKYFHYYLRKYYHLIVNSKKIYRLCKEHNLLLPKNKKQRRGKGQQLSSNWIIDDINQMWQFDIKYIYIHGEARFAYFLGFIDVFSREIVNFYLGLKCTSEQLKSTLLEALLRKGIFTGKNNLVIRSDRGTQMTSHKFVKYVETLTDVIHELIPPHSPNKNAYIESFNSLLEIETLQNIRFKSYEEVYSYMVRYVTHYNDHRLHGALNYMTPNEFVQRYSSGDINHTEVSIGG
jgi:putative transposase